MRKRVMAHLLESVFFHGNRPVIKNAGLGAGLASLTIITKGNGGNMNTDYLHGLSDANVIARSGFTPLHAVENSGFKGRFVGLATLRMENGG